MTGFLLSKFQCVAGIKIGVFTFFSFISALFNISTITQTDFKALFFWPYSIDNVFRTNVDYF